MPAFTRRVLLVGALLLISGAAHAVVGSCPVNFPDGIQSHYTGNANSKGNIQFDYNAQLLGSPDNVLGAQRIARNTGSNVPTCGSADCSANDGLPAPKQNPGAFPALSGTTNYTLGYQQTGTLNGNGTNQYNKITLDSDAQLTISSGGQSFYINQLTLGSSSRLYLSPGDYWIGSLATNDGSQIQVQGTGQVRLFVRDDVSLASASLYNSSGINSSGDADKLFLYAYEQVSLKNLATFSGYIYSAASQGSNDSVTLGSASYVFGAITSENILLGAGSQVTYRAPAGDCGETAEILSWSLDEQSWTGAAGEVLDTSGNNLNGRAINGATTASAAPALPAVSDQGTCGYGSFSTGSSQYVEAAHNSLLSLQQSFTIGLWVKPRSRPSSGLMSILSKDENYEFHLNPNGTINWWWRTTNAAVQFNSSAALPVGEWSHVLIRYAPGNQRIYINGSLAGQANFSGTPLANNDPLQLGWDQIAGRYFDGELDELRIYRGALSPAQITALVNERHACTVALQCVSDNFNRANLGADWVVSSRGLTSFTPAITDNRLRLTSNQGNVATATALQRLFPGEGNYIQAEFKYYAYNGNGADGIALILSDASQTPQPGGYGGSLGYAQLNNTSGFSGGWLGVALDEYGNFSNPTENRQGGPGRRPDSVSIRGPGSGTTGYRYLAGTAAGLNPGVDSASSSTAAPGHTYRITIDARTSGKALVTVERDTGSGFVVLPGLESFDALAASGETTIPENFFLSLTGSTGGSNNIHEVDDLQVCASEIRPVGQQIHHFDFRYSSPSLTCNPQDVVVTACLNASCSEVYTDPVEATLTATEGAVWHGGNTIAFERGRATPKVQVTQVGEAVIGVAGSTPPAQSFSQTTCSTPGCKLVGVKSGFLFDIPTLTAAKPQTDIAFRAVEADKSDPQKCVPGFEGGTRTVQFSKTYSNPITGTRPVIVNGTSVETAVTDVALDFDSQAVAKLTVRYDDVGLMDLNAHYAPIEGNEAGLIMEGTDSFLSKPYGLCIQTDVTAEQACNTDDINCPLFRSGETVIRAGDVFPMTVRAVGWETDGETLTADKLCSANITTPNFKLNGVNLASQRTAPEQGVEATLSASSYNHGIGEQTSLEQSVSEVGIFRLVATPPSYFGEPIGGGTSNRVGRFSPAYLGAEAFASLTPSCGAAFSYQGQPIGFAPGNEPTLTITGYNRHGQVTQNYDRGNFWRLDAPTVGSYASIVDRPGVNARLQTGGEATLQIQEQNNGGARIYSWSGQTLSYAPAAVPSADDLEFTAKVTQTFSAASLTDSDGACLGSGTGCQGFAYEFSNDPGSRVRLGRLRLGNAHGSELQSLAMPVTIESWQSSSADPPLFLREHLDSCTTDAVLAAPMLGNFTGNLGDGDTEANVGEISQGTGQINLSAPGRGNDGSLQLTLPVMPDWLRYDWDGNGARESARGLASFGIYKGSPPLIFRREVYR